jgi:uncharacterized membrane protein YbaN (DUF454 family)
MSKPKKPFKDYSHETKIVANPALRYLWLGLGLFFTGLGFIGAFLPVMPTTVFLLIAAYFFARSSRRFYNWLLNNPIFGQLIRDWRAGLGIPLRAKVMAITVIALTIGYSVYRVPLLWLKLVLLLTGVTLSLYLITRPTKTVN